ncbi:dynein light chain binding protein [Aureococcus anophagefferens]|uniref:Dynein light chain binding protein n=1 Tax=Aureococcus anophagefferens TaxID=44056 RepID=A0ABR1G328_AURAN
MVLDEVQNVNHDVRVAKPASAPIAMAEGPLKTFLVPLGQALIGASRESVEAAITNDIASSESAIASFVAATTADACLLMGVDDGAVAFSRNFSPLPERFVAVGRSAASGAALSSIIEEYGDSTDLGEHCAVVLSGRGGTHGQTETLAVARQLLRAAVRPLVAEASSGGTEAEEAMAPRLVAVAQRLGDLEAALGRCDRRARLAEATLAPPAAVERFLEGGGSGDGAGARADATRARRDGALARVRGRAARAGDSRRSPGGRAVAHVLKRAKRFVAAAQLEDGVARRFARSPRSPSTRTRCSGICRSRPSRARRRSTIWPRRRRTSSSIWRSSRSRHYAAAVARRAPSWKPSGADAAAARMRLLDDGAGALLADEDAEAADRCFAPRALAKAEVPRAGARAHAPRRALAARGDMRRVANLELFHEKVEARLGELRKFKADHHKFRGVLATVLAARGRGDDRSAASALGELDGAYERFLSELAAELEAAATADETFAVFATFQPLLDRPAVRARAAAPGGASSTTVKRDVDGLKDACTKRYEGSNAAVVASLRDLPPLGGKILWARRWSGGSTREMARLSGVLGGDRAMERHPRGRALRTVADELLRHLDATPLFEEWLGTWKRSARRRVAQRAESELGASSCSTSTSSATPGPWW